MYAYKFTDDGDCINPTTYIGTATTSTTEIYVAGMNRRWVYGYKFNKTSGEIYGEYKHCMFHQMNSTYESKRDAVIAAIAFLKKRRFAKERSCEKAIDIAHSDVTQPTLF